MDSSDFNRLSGTQLTNSPLNTDLPEDSSIFSSFSSASSSNVAPILRDTGVTLNFVSEDSPAPFRGAGGTPVSSIVVLGSNVTDTDRIIGIAITELGTDSNGTWYFTTDNGIQWAPIGDVSENNALLLTANTDTRIYFQPAANYFGFTDDAITFRAWDTSRGASGTKFDVSVNGGTTAFSFDTDTASLNVLAVNDSPVIVVPVTTPTTRLDFNEDTTLEFKGDNAIRVTDIEGDGTFEITLAATSGTLSLSDSINSSLTSTISFTGSLSSINATLEKLVYRPINDYNGIVNIRVSTIDRPSVGGAPTSDEDFIYLNVLPVNDAPFFSKGSNDTVDEDSGLRVVSWATNISKGAVNEFNQTVRFEVTNLDDSNLFAIAPSIDANGFLRYQAKANVFGSANISVKLIDSEGAESQEETFSITVNPVNDAPINIIPSQTPQTVKEDSVLTFSNTRNNAISISDIDAGAGIMQVRVEAANGILTATAATGLDIRDNNTNSVFLTGTLESINAGLEGLTFAPSRNFNGSTFITITTNDQNNTGKGPAYTDIDRININVIPVNDVPRFNKGVDQVVKEDTPPQNILWATDISTGALNENNQSLRFIVTNDNNSLFVNQPTISPNGILSYTLAPNQNGVANVTVVLRDDGDNSDGGAGTSAAETFTINVTPANDAPVNRVPNIQTILEDSEFIFTGNNAISVSDIDAGNNPIQVRVTTNNGILTWNDSQVLSTAQGKGTNTVILTGTVNSINTDLNGLIFKPNTNFNGLAFIQVVTNDQGSTGGDNAWQASNNILIQVNPVNDVPEFAKGVDITVNEDVGLVQIPGWATRINTGGVDETQALEFIVRNSNNALFVEQPRISINGSLGTLLFRTAANANGTAKVFVRLRDNGSTLNNGVDASLEQEFTININAVNDAPANRVLATQSMDEDGTLIFSARNSINNSITVSDIDGEAVTLETTISTENGTLSLANSDDQLTSIIVTGTASQINAALDGLKFKPTANFHGNARIQVLTNDQGNIGGGAITDTDIITVTVNPVNDAPTFTPGADITVSEDGERYNQVWATNLSSGALDDPTQKLKFLVRNSNNTLFSEQPSIDSEGKLIFKSAANANGEATVTVQLQDDGGVLKGGKDTSESVTFKITVTPVADAPINNIPARIPPIVEDTLDLPIFAINRGNPITITEVDGEPNATVQVTISSEQGTIRLGNATLVSASTDFSSNISFSGALGDVNRALNGLTFKPNLNFNGKAEIKITSGKQGQEDTDTIVIDVIPANDAPTVTVGSNLEVSAGADFKYEKWATFSPGPEDESKQEVLEYIISSVSNNTLFATRPAIDREGNLIFTTARGIKTPTTATIGVRVRDNGGINNGGVDLSEEKTFTITVKPIEASITTTTEFVKEGNFANTNYSFNVTLTGANNEAVTIKYSTADETAKVADRDYQETSGTITFAPGETSKTITVAVRGDTKFETDQTFRVNLLEATNANLVQTISATGTIQDDDTRPIINVSNGRGTEGGSILKVPVSLSNASDEEVRVEYEITNGTAVNGEDYTLGADPLVVVFAPGETRKTIDVALKDDDKLEPNKTFFVEIKNPTNGTISTTANKATATIINDDAKNTTDINGNGYSDIVLRNYRTGENVIWLMNEFTIENGVIIERQKDVNWVLAGVGDFTYEGKQDFLYHNIQTGQNEIWMMDGIKLERVLPLLSFKDTNWKITGVTDFNADRNTDIMWYNAASGESMIWYMDGAVVRQSISLPKVFTKTLEIAHVADLSGDGKKDIVWYDRATGATTVWVMGEKTAETAVILEAQADTNIRIQGAGDFNNDGKLDIVVSNYITGENTVWYLDNIENTIKISEKGKLPKSKNTSMRLEQITDFDNDGYLDFFYRDYYSGENEIWRMLGTECDQIIKLPKLKEQFWKTSI
jgi:Calx-beta domain/FG-GAP-like repeat/Bacterial Ig domain